MISPDEMTCQHVCAGAGPYYIAQFVPYTPASYAMHQAPAGGFAYMGMPGQFLGVMAPPNGHASQHTAPMSPYPQHPPVPPAFVPNNGPPGHIAGTWAPRGNDHWNVQGGYGTKVTQVPLARPEVLYTEQMEGK